MTAAPFYAAHDLPRCVRYLGARRCPRAPAPGGMVCEECALAERVTAKMTEGTVVSDQSAEWNPATLCCARPVATEGRLVALRNACWEMAERDAGRTV